LKSRDRFCLQAFWLSLTFLACLTPVGAVTLFPGDSLPLSGTTTSDRPEIGAPVFTTQLANFQQTDVIGNVLFSGTVEQRVRQFPLGGILIDYQITNFTDNGEGFRITALDTNHHYGSMLDVDYRLDEMGDVAPNAAIWPDFTFDPAFNDAPVSFNFPDSLLSGNTSRDMFVVTYGGDILVYGAHGAQLTVAGQSGDIYQVSFESFSAIIPIPPALYLFATGLLGLPGMARRKAAY